MATLGFLNPLSRRCPSSERGIVSASHSAWLMLPRSNACFSLALDVIFSHLSKCDAELEEPGNDSAHHKPRQEGGFPDTSEQILCSGKWLCPLGMNVLPFVMTDNPLAVRLGVINAHRASCICPSAWVPATSSLQCQSSNSSLFPARSSTQPPPA